MQSLSSVRFSFLRRSPSLFSATKTGTVKSFAAKRGFGFVTLEDGKEVFVHNSDIKATGFRMLVPNAKVKFEMTEKDGKFRASQVRNLDDSPIEAPARRSPDQQPQRDRLPRDQQQQQQQQQQSRPRFGQQRK